MIYDILLEFFSRLNVFIIEKSPLLVWGGYSPILKILIGMSVLMSVSINELGRVFSKHNQGKKEINYIV